MLTIMASIAQEESRSTSQNVKMGFQYRFQKSEMQEHNAQRQTKRQRISETTEFLAMQSGIITEYDDKLTRQLIEKITVFDDKFRVAFKSGVEIEVEI